MPAAASSLPGPAHFLEMTLDLHKYTTHDRTGFLEILGGFLRQHCKPVGSNMLRFVILHFRARILSLIASSPVCFRPIVIHVADSTARWATRHLSLIDVPSQFHRAPGKLYRWGRPAGTWCARAGLGSLTTEVISNRYPVLSRSWEVGSRMRKSLLHRAITKRSQT